MDNNNLAIESFISFCDDMMIVEEGAQIDAFKIYKGEDVKELRRKFKYAKKIIKSDPDMAISEFNEIKSDILKVKQQISAIKDDSGKFKKFMSYLNPLLLFINNEETKAIVPTGNGYVRLVKTYSDKLSKNSANAMAKKTQEALNLFSKKCDDCIQVAMKVKKNAKVDKT